MKLAVTHHLLAGGDALDIAVIFDIYAGRVGTIMYHVLVDWIKQPNIGGINMSNI